jgi:hypothetical protein
MLGLALVVTGAAFVFALCVKASLDATRGNGPSDVPDGLPLLVYSLDVVLLLIATLGLIAVTLLAVRERMREFGILKTLGFTPRQITLSLTGAISSWPWSRCSSHCLPGWRSTPSSTPRPAGRARGVSSRRRLGRPWSSSDW